MRARIRRDLGEAIEEPRQFDGAG